MIRFLAGGIAVIAVGSTAYAADIEETPTYSWGGLYVGLHGGYLWGDVEVEEEGEPTTPGGSVDGLIGGALAGYNLNLDPIVLGVEADFGFTDAEGEGADGGDSDGDGLVEAEYDYELDWIAHVRARAGFAFERALIFIAGGWAIADLDIDQEYATRFGGTYYGYTFGGGIDYAFTDTIIGRIEYLHDEFGQEDYDVEGEDYSADFSADIVRAAVTIKFNP